MPPPEAPLVIDADRLLAAYGNQMIGLTPASADLLIRLAQGPAAPAAIAIDFGVSVATIASLYTTLRRAMAKAAYPPMLRLAGGVYRLDVAAQIVRRKATPLDEVSRAIIRRLVDACSDHRVADIARRHFGME